MKAQVKHITIYKLTHGRELKLLCISHDLSQGSADVAVVTVAIHYKGLRARCNLYAGMSGFCCELMKELLPVCVSTKLTFIFCTIHLQQRILLQNITFS